jgi:hypothetical protein
MQKKSADETGTETDFASAESTKNLRKKPEAFFLVSNF